MLRVDIAGFLFDMEEIVKKLVMKLTFAKTDFEQRNFPIEMQS